MTGSDAADGEGVSAETSAVGSVAASGAGSGASTGSVWRSIADGFGAVRTEPGLRVSFIAMCVNSALAAPFIALIPAMAGDVLDGDETTISILVTAQGVGAVVAALKLGLALVPDDIELITDIIRLEMRARRSTACSRTASSTCRRSSSSFC